MRRLGEKVDENSAAVVQALVKMVVEDVSKRRSEEVGLTAEQLVAKIERDRSANSILKHLLEKTSSFEKRRLLLKIIPNRYLELSQEMIEAESPRMRGFTTTLNDLELCFRLAFDAASKGTKEEVTDKFVKVLKEETTRIVSIYEETFFRGGDLEYLSSENRTMVKEHFLSRLMVKQTSNIKLMAASEGIGKFLTHREAQMFVDAVVRVMVYGENEMEWEPTKEVLLAELQRMDPQILSAITSRIGYWIHTFNAKKQIEAAKTCTRMIEAVQNQIAYNSLPDFPDE